jgi:hypothetical protein
MKHDQLAQDIFVEFLLLFMKQSIIKALMVGVISAEEYLILEDNFDTLNTTIWKQ